MKDQTHEYPGRTRATVCRTPVRRCRRSLDAKSSIDAERSERARRMRAGLLAWMPRGARQSSRVSLGKFTLTGHCRFRFKVSYDTITHVNLDGQSSFLTKLTRAPRRGRPDGRTGSADERGAQAGAACASGVDGAPSRTSTSRVPARRDALALLTSRTCSGSVGGSRCVRYH